MTLAELAATLPWGLHDAYLEALELEWLRARLALTARVMIGEHQETDQRARFVVDGLVFCSIDPPEIDPAKGYEASPEGGLWIDDGPGAAPSSAAALPATPDGCFLHWLYVRGWNRFIHVCARDARLEWLEHAPVAARAATRALFPGDQIPDPSRAPR